MQKAKTTQMVIAGAVGCILFIIFSWWLGLIAAGLAFLGFEIKNFTDEKLVDVFGEEISTKFARPEVVTVLRKFYDSQV